MPVNVMGSESRNQNIQKSSGSVTTLGTTESVIGHSGELGKVKFRSPHVSFSECTIVNLTDQKPLVDLGDHL